MVGRVGGKVAIVTGAASGIGLACAKALAEEGASVLLTDIADGESVAAEIRATGGRAEYRRQDVTSEGEWIEIVAHCEERFGGLNILVANAGVALGGPIVDYPFETWRRQIAVNLDSVFLSAKYSIPAMRRSGSGSIIMISSTAAMQGSVGLSAYCASKGGVRLFSKAVAVECARQGDNIRCNSVHPGIIQTGIWTANVPKNPEFLFGDAAASDSIDAGKLAQMVVPGGKLGYPEDIANGVVYLASDDARYVNGTELVIDGGVLAG